MRRAAFIWVALAVLALAFACTKTDNKTVAKLGKDAITVKMIKDQYLAITPSSRPDLKTIDEKEAFAKDIVSKQIMWLEGRKLGLDRMPQVTQAGQNAVARRAWQDFYEEQIRSQVKITDKDLQDIFAKQASDYHLAWIFVRSKTLADQIAARLKAGEDFAKLASLFSIDPSRGEGGDIGVRSLGLMPAPIADKVMQMSPGQTSDILAYDTYYAIIRVLEKTDRQPTSFEEARQGLEAIARATAENARQRQVAEDLKKAYELTFNNAVADMIVAKTLAANQAGGPPGVIPEFSEEEMARDLATWKGGALKVRDYVERMKAMADYMRPGYGADRASVESLVADHVTGELWGLEIKTKGYDTRPDAVEAGQRAMEEAVVTALHDQLVKDVTVDDAKIAEFYELTKAQLVTETGVKIAAIITADTTAAKAAYDQLASGAAFETVAKQRSTDETLAASGGHLPRPLYKSDLEQFPDLEGVLDNLKVGGYSTPMPVPPGFGAEGYMVVKLVERLEPRQLELAEIKDMLKPRVLQYEQDKVFGEWLKSKMEEYKIEVFPDVLERIDFTLLKGQGA